MLAFGHRICNAAFAARRFYMHSMAEGLDGKRPMVQITEEVKPQECVYVARYTLYQAVALRRHMDCPQLQSSAPHLYVNQQPHPPSPKGGTVPRTAGAR
jgi:hypothetical protein